MWIWRILPCQGCLQCLQILVCPGTLTQPWCHCFLLSLGGGGGQQGSHLAMGRKQIPVLVSFWDAYCDSILFRCATFSSQVCAQEAVPSLTCPGDLPPLCSSAGQWQWCGQRPKDRMISLLTSVSGGGGRISLAGLLWTERWLLPGFVVPATSQVHKHACSCSGSRVTVLAHSF